MKLTRSLQRLLSNCPAVAATLVMSAILTQQCVYAQQNEPNILGLPVVPQPKPGSSAALAQKAGAAPAAAPTPMDRGLLLGEMGIQHSARDGIGRLLFTTKNTYTTAGQRSSALDAAKSIQQELGKACGTQCKPQSMSAPLLQPNGQLQFELVFKPLHKHLDQAQFIAALQGRPLNLTPDQLKPPVIAAPQVQVQIDQGAAANK